MLRSARRRPLDALRAVALATALGIAAPTWAAGPMDFLFSGGGMVPSADAGRAWKISEFSAVRLAPREAGAPANQHPVTIEPERLRALLGVVEVMLAGGEYKPLFTRSELEEMVPVLARALAAATPGDDLLLLASARREQGILSIPVSATARLFVADQALHLIVQEARLDALSSYRAMRVVPSFGFGSRVSESATKLRAAASVARRGDWLALPLGAPAAAAPAPVVAPAAVAAPATPPAVPAAAPPVATVPPPAGAPAPPPAPARSVPASPEDIERRLTTLKRLRDRGLISEEEYQAKRREILQQL